MFLFEPCQPKNLMITHNFSVNIGGEVFQKNIETMQRISSTVSKVIGSVCPNLSLSIELKSIWSEIVGEEFVALTSLREARYINDGISVCINVLSSAAIIFKYNSAEITDRISKLVGIRDVKLVIKQVADLNPKMNSRDKDAA